MPLSQSEDTDETLSIWLRPRMTPLMLAKCKSAITN
jgi:hypothetical protein